MSIAYIKIDGKHNRVVLNKGELLVSAFNRIGLETPQSCLSGYCSSCKCLLEKGEVDIVKNLVLTDNELEQGYILSCQSVINSDVIVVNYDF